MCSPGLAHFVLMTLSISSFASGQGPPPGHQEYEPPEMPATQGHQYNQHYPQGGQYNPEYPQQAAGHNSNPNPELEPVEGRQGVNPTMNYQGTQYQGMARGNPAGEYIPGEQTNYGQYSQQNGGGHGEAAPGSQGSHGNVRQGSSATRIGPGHPDYEPPEYEVTPVPPSGSVQSQIETASQTYRHGEPALSIFQNQNSGHPGESVLGRYTGHQLNPIIQGKPSDPMAGEGFGNSFQSTGMSLVTTTMNPEYEAPEIVEVLTTSPAPSLARGIHSQQQIRTTVNPQTAKKPSAKLSQTSMQSKTNGITQQQYTAFNNYRNAQTGRTNLGGLADAQSFLGYQDTTGVHNQPSNNPSYSTNPKQATANKLKHSPGPSAVQNGQHGGGNAAYTKPSTPQHGLNTHAVQLPNTANHGYLSTKHSNSQTRHGMKTLATGNSGYKQNSAQTPKGNPNVAYVIGRNGQGGVNPVKSSISYQQAIGNQTPGSVQNSNYFLSRGASQNQMYKMDAPVPRNQAALPTFANGGFKNTIDQMRMYSMQAQARRNQGMSQNAANPVSQHSPDQMQMYSNGAFSQAAYQNAQQPTQQNHQPSQYPGSIPLVPIFRNGAQMALTTLYGQPSYSPGQATYNVKSQNFQHHIPSKTVYDGNAFVPTQSAGSASFPPNSATYPSHVPQVQQGTPGHKGADAPSDSKKLPSTEPHSGMTLTHQSRIPTHTGSQTVEHGPPSTSIGAEWTSRKSHQQTNFNQPRFKQVGSPIQPDLIHSPAASGEVLPGQTSSGHIANRQNYDILKAHSFQTNSKPLEHPSAGPHQNPNTHMNPKPMEIPQANSKVNLNPAAKSAPSQSYNTQGTQRNAQGFGAMQYSNSVSGTGTNGGQVQETMVTITPADIRAAVEQAISYLLMLGQGNRQTGQQPVF